MSLPVRGAWIEMSPPPTRPPAGYRSLPVRGAWIEIFQVMQKVGFRASLPVRGAWIEIRRGCSRDRT